jgi:hypothetical protein
MEENNQNNKSIEIVTPITPQPEILVNNSEQIGRDPITGQLHKGVVLNPNGRPKGAKNFKTIFFKALKKLAETNDKKAEELFIEIISKGISNARNGDYKFYKDILDRVYGKPQESIDHTTGGEKMLQGNVIQFVSFGQELPIENNHEDEDDYEDDEIFAIEDDEDDEQIQGS